MVDHEELHPSASATYPVIGESTEGLGEYFVRTRTLSDAEAYKPIRRDALAIIERSRPFSDGDGTRTGLVVGYVQSGKTLSMTTVSALARDNGCRIVILLAGVTTNLLQQNANRFKHALRGASGRATAWRVFNSQDGLGATDLQALKQAVAEWRDPAFSEMDRQTFLYLVLKNHAHLKQLHKHLSEVKLSGIPALILDDEADQAGLNTRVDDPDGSTTYRQIKLVRDALPHHTYLQYTATPQAPLLIALDDKLSPAFAELVEPGDGYTGGLAFFGPESPAGLVKSIPAEDLFKPGEPPEIPPESMLEAMRVFFVGCAVMSLRGGPAPRSMLIHPSPRTSDHKRYLGWVSEVIKRWTATLRGQDEDERRDTLKEFREAHVDLLKTDQSLPAFDDVVQRLLVSLGRVSLKEVNSEDGSEIDWDNADEHILIGGEKLNRGFTVEGLTVTYMPRDAGGWMADTVQQRARFFGYKSKYLPLCRLYLHTDVIRAYRAYVVHEEAIRKQLAHHRGKPLRDWRRAFFLDAKMRPTRRNVLADPYYRVEAKHLWFVPRYPHADLEAVSRNQKRLLAIQSKSKFESRDEYFKHQVAEVSLKEFYRDVLVDYDVRGPDLPKWYAQLVTIGDIVDDDEDPTARMLLVRMHESRERKAVNGALTLHQGRSSSQDEADAYPGDAKMCDENLVTVQIHWVDVKDGGPMGVAALAIHIPDRLRRDDVGVQTGK